MNASHTCASFDERVKERRSIEWRSRFEDPVASYFQQFCHHLQTLLTVTEKSSPGCLLTQAVIKAANRDPLRFSQVGVVCFIFSIPRTHKNDNLNVTIRHQLSLSSLFVFDSASRHVAAFNVLKSLFWIEHVHWWIELCSVLNGHESVLIELWFHSEHKKL